jgi:hypothetical protein
MSEKSPEEKAQAKKQGLIKAQNAGFSKGKAIDPIKKTSTELFEAQIDLLPKLVRQSFEVWERGMSSDNLKIAVDTAHKFTGHYHRPTTNVNVSGSTNAGDVTFNIVNVDGLKDEDKELLRKMKDLKAAETEPEIVDAEAVED